ncbi:MAG: hypothetical protein ABIL44_07835 [candidate division WOR-3 bacterium]
MDNNDKKSIPKGTRPSEEEVFYTKMARETLKNNLQFANEVLRQLVSITSVLLGGFIIFQYPGFSQVMRQFIIILLLGSLIIALIGILPFEGSVDIRMPNEIKKHKEEALKWKHIHLWLAAGLLVISLTIAFVALVSKKIWSCGAG